MSTACSRARVRKRQRADARSTSGASPSGEAPLRAVQAPWFRSSIPSVVRWVSWRSSYRTAARTVIYIPARCGHVHDGQVDHRNCRGSVILHPSIASVSMGSESRHESFYGQVTALRQRPNVHATSHCAFRFCRLSSDARAGISPRPFYTRLKS